MPEAHYVTRQELADSIQMLRDEIAGLRADLNAAVAALSQRLDRHERWLTVLSTGQAITLLVLIYVVLKLGI